MKIEDNRKEMMPISILKIGNVFQYGDDFYLKTNRTKRGNSEKDYMVDCTNIKTGAIVSIPFDKSVMPLNAKIVIE